MRPPDDGRVERLLEGAFGALADWLEAVRRHDDDSRARKAAAERARRDQAAVIIMAVLSVLTIAAFALVRTR